MTELLYADKGKVKDVLNKERITETWNGRPRPQPAPTYTHCPYCGANLGNLVKKLKEAPVGTTWQDFFESYMRIHQDCGKCVKIIKDQYVNPYGNWREGGHNS